MERPSRHTGRAALAAPWPGPPVWFHGDIADGNLLVRDGRLAAVIDFGTSGVGDPACDLVIAWTMFAGESRGGLPPRRPPGPRDRRVINEVLADHDRRP